MIKPWPISKQYVLNSNEMNNNDPHAHHTRETPSPEFAVFKMGMKDKSVFFLFSFFSSFVLFNTLYLLTMTRLHN